MSASAKLRGHPAHHPAAEAMLREARALALAAGPADPGKSRQVKAAMKKPACSSSLVQGRSDDFEEAERWHQRLQVIGKKFYHNKHHKGWILNAR